MGELGKTSLIRDIPYLNSVDFSDRETAWGLKHAGIGLISETHRDSQEVLWVRVTI